MISKAAHAAHDHHDGVAHSSHDDHDKKDAPQGPKKKVFSIPLKKLDINGEKLTLGPAKNKPKQPNSSNQQATKGPRNPGMPTQPAKIVPHDPVKENDVSKASDAAKKSDSNDADAKETGVAKKNDSHLIKVTPKGKENQRQISANGSANNPKPVDTRIAMSTQELDFYGIQRPAEKSKEEKNEPSANKSKSPMSQELKEKIKQALKKSGPAGQKASQDATDKKADKKEEDKPIPIDQMYTNIAISAQHRDFLKRNAGKKLATDTEELSKIIGRTQEGLNLDNQKGLKVFMPSDSTSSNMKEAPSNRARDNAARFDKSAPESQPKSPNL